MTDYLYNPNYHRLASLLDLDTHERQEANVSEKLLFLHDWAVKRSGANSINQVLSMVTRLKRDLGTTQRGKILLKDMYKWVRLDQDSMRLEENKSSIRDMAQENEQNKKQAIKNSIKRADKWQKDKIKEENISKEAEKKAEKLIDRSAVKQERVIEKIKSGNIKIKDSKEVLNEPQEIKL